MSWSPGGGATEGSTVQRDPDYREGASPGHEMVPEAEEAWGLQILGFSFLLSSNLLPAPANG